MLPVPIDKRAELHIWEHCFSDLGQHAILASRSNVASIAIDHSFIGIIISLLYCPKTYKNQIFVLNVHIKFLVASWRQDTQRDTSNVNSYIISTSVTANCFYIGYR